MSIINDEYLILNETELCWLDRFIDEYLDAINPASILDIKYEKAFEKGSLINYVALTNLYSKHGFELKQIVENDRHFEMSYAIVRHMSPGQMVINYETILIILEKMRSCLNTASKYKYIKSKDV